MRGAIPPLSQYALMAWRSVKAQEQLYVITTTTTTTVFQGLDLLACLKFIF
jgi:hypothetical protein